MDFFENMANAEREIYDKWKSISLNMTPESARKYRVRFSLQCDLIVWPKRRPNLFKTGPKLLKIVLTC